MKQGIYLVTGERNYRGHPKGETFTARLDRAAQKRAVARGAIKLLGHVEPSIEPERLIRGYLSEGWLPQPQPTTKGAERRLSHSRR